MQGWVAGYRRQTFRFDLAAGLTVAAMLVPQAMAYALLAGLPPQVGLYAATVPVLAYAVLGTSRQLAVGPVAIVSLLTASTLSQVADETNYVAVATLLAFLVGAVHLVLAVGRLGFLVNFLSHSVLVGFTGAAAIIIGFSQVKHLLGISIERKEHFYQTVLEVVNNIGATNLATLGLGGIALVALFALKRVAKALPSALIVVAAAIAASEVFDLEGRGVKVVGEIPNDLPVPALPTFDVGLVGELLPTALVITIVGFLESIAVAKVYARRHRYDVEVPNELYGLGAANIAAGLFGGYPVTGGFSRTAVNDTAGARTPMASIITAIGVGLAIVFLTPVLSQLPQAALGAIIIAAVVGLFDIKEMRHIASVKPSDLISLSVAFFATLALGIEIGIGIAVVASMLVVFARMSRPHSAVLGKIAPGVYRNVNRYPDAETFSGVKMLRIDAALSFANASFVKKLLRQEAADHQILVLDASGINDIDATGAATFEETLTELGESGIDVFLADVKGPVRDVFDRAHLSDRLAGQMFASIDAALQAAREVCENRGDDCNNLGTTPSSAVTLSGGNPLPPDLQTTRQ